MGRVIGGDVSGAHGWTIPTASARSRRACDHSRPLSAQAGATVAPSSDACREGRMGQEARCTMRYGERISEGKALLETSELLFRGEFRLKIPFGAMRSIEARDGDLTIAFEGELATFELGRQAERWAEK